jgi:hypothetical protein
MFRALRGTLALAGAFSVMACGATTFNSSWKAPDAQPINFAGQKVLALVVSPNESNRRAAEEALARELTARGVQGVPGYTVLPTEIVQAKDRERGREMVDKSGVVGVVSMRLVGKDKEITSTPGMWSTAPYYGSYWGGYYGYGWGAVYDPGYIRTDTILSVETLVHDLKQNKLVWAGQSATTNPSDADKFMRELVDEAVKEMRKQGLIRPRS